MTQAYDVIVVGAGSGGVPLAARLAEDPTRSVLLLEAGPNFVGADAFPPELRYGGLFGGMMPGHPNNWGAVATIREGLRQPNPRGRVIGGSSAVNGTLFTRGLPEDFDGWAREGNPEWSYERVLPAFKSLETDHDIQDAYHGTSGPVPIQRTRAENWSPIDRAFVAACRAAGFPDDADLNGPKSIGVGALPVNNLRGIRMNTALSYFGAGPPRPNLTVRGGALVTRVLLDGKTAVGVEAVVDGQLTRFSASEVVLSAGAIRSPHLLMLSGIGPADELRPQGIAVTHELPMVGRGFTDHCSLTLPFRVSKRRNPIPDPLQSAWAHVALHFTTPSSPTHSDMMLIQSSIPTTLCVTYGQSLAAQYRMLRATAGKMSFPKLVDYVRNGWDHAITCIMQQDSSRGELHLTSADPNDNPTPRYHYLEAEADRRRLREGYRAAATLIASDAYGDLRVRRAYPGDDILGSDAHLDKHLLARMGTSMHMASSCRMGPSPETAVVDQYCRVHGLAGLRVVDSSIMPTVVRRCPAATAIMIGERAAAFFG